MKLPTPLCIISIALLSFISTDETQAAPQAQVTLQEQYASLWEKAQQAFASKKYNQALQHYLQVIKLLPYEPSSRFQIACCYAQLNQTNLALQALEEAIRYGWDDVEELQQNELLKSLQEQSRMETLVADARRCRDELLVIYAGKKVDANKPTALLILLHGLGSGPRSELPYWQATADELNLVILAPRATTAVGKRLSYGWRKPDAKNATELDLISARNRIKAGIGLVQSRYLIDTHQVFLAGFSQGAGMALNLIADDPLKYAGLISICAQYQPLGDIVWKNVTGLNNSLQFIVLAGERDPLLPKSKALVEELTKAELPCVFKIMPGLGHELPARYQDEQIAAAKQILPFYRNKIKFAGNPQLINSK